MRPGASGTQTEGSAVVSMPRPTARRIYPNASTNASNGPAIRPRYQSHGVSATDTCGAAKSATSTGQTACWITLRLNQR